MDGFSAARICPDHGFVKYMLDKCFTRGESLTSYELDHIISGLAESHHPIDTSRINDIKKLIQHDRIKLQRPSDWIQLIRGLCILDATQKQFGLDNQRDIFALIDTLIEHLIQICAKGSSDFNIQIGNTVAYSQPKSAAVTSRPILDLTALDLLDSHKSMLITIRAYLKSQRYNRYNYIQKIEHQHVQEMRDSDAHNRVFTFLNQTLTSRDGYFVEKEVSLDGTSSPFDIKVTKSFLDNRSPRYIFLEINGDQHYMNSASGGMKLDRLDPKRYLKVQMARSRKIPVLQIHNRSTNTQKELADILKSVEKFL